MAATIQLDISSATRFVSSLSKSLQALCHGCMDFDSQIEIIGYINVNVDCNGKVDCVLNEKVSKSIDNSMTFVSNSFLAKKDECKIMKERACSPVAELSSMADIYEGSGPSLLSSSQHYRSSSIFSPHSQVVRGSQKRSWSGSGMPASQKKSAKGSKSQHHPYQSVTEGTSSINSHSQQNTSFSDTSQKKSAKGSKSLHLPPQSLTEGTSFMNNQSQQSISFSETPISQTDYHSNTTQETPIKTENPDEFSQFISQNSTSTVDQASDKLDVSIKSDPEYSVIPFMSDIAQLKEDPGCNPNQSVSSSIDPSQTSHIQNLHSEPVDHVQFGAGYSGAQANYDPQEGSSCNQLYSAQPSGDASEFDIIEIGEDEEADEVADTKQRATASSQPKRKPLKKIGDAGSTVSSSPPSLPWISEKSKEYHFDAVTGKYCCPYCQKQYVAIASVTMHIKIKHKGWFAFYCDICRKGFQRKDHLQGHLASHGLPMQYECVDCGAKYAHKTSLRNHEKMIHDKD